MLTNNANNNDKHYRSRTSLTIINTITTVRELTWNKERKVSNNQVLPRLSKVQKIT